MSACVRPSAFAAFEFRALATYPPVRALGTSKISPWLEPYTSDELERLKKVCPNILFLLGENDMIVGGGWGSWPPHIGLGFKPGEHEASVREQFPWSDIQMSKDRGHYVVSSLLQSEMDMILKLGPNSCSN